MALAHSYKITLSNNKTEKQAINYLLGVDKQFLLPDKEGRQQVLKALDLDKKFSRTFDLFILPGYVNTQTEILLQDSKNITLIELKTTQKFLPNNPKGFFFGATKNEFDLAEKLGVQYKFCFVSLHPDSLGHALLSLGEVENIIVNKRVQYQVNL